MWNVERFVNSSQFVVIGAAICGGATAACGGGAAVAGLIVAVRVVAAQGGAAASRGGPAAAHGGAAAARDRLRLFAADLLLKQILRLNYNCHTKKLLVLKENDPTQHQKNRLDPDLFYQSV